MEKFLKKLTSGDTFNVIVAELTMWSKYVIAGGVIIYLKAWTFALPMLLAGILALLIGALLGMIAGKWHWIVKYIVIAVELYIFRSSLLSSFLGIPGFALFLSAPLVGNLIGEFQRNILHSEDKPAKKQSILKRAINYVLLSKYMFGIERVFKLFLGCYFTLIFGLVNPLNEVIVLSSFGVIGAVEYGEKAKNVCKRCYQFLSRKGNKHA